jgi:hypothetical protein
MKYPKFLLPAIAGLALLIAGPTRADDMASIEIAPATGAVTLTPRWTIGANIAGFHFMAQDLSLGGGPNQFYSVKGTAIPVNGDTSAFTIYLPASGAATVHTDIGSKLRPNSYSSLTSADPDLGYGSIQFYFIHHKSDGDYFAHIVPGSGTASAVEDLKPMSQPGNPTTGGLSGYLGLTFAASDLGYGANLFYYLRNHPVTGFATFGSLVPALAGTSTDHADLGIAGYNALAYTPTDVGYGGDQLYYQRLDPVTGFTILGRLDASNGRSYDIANLGSVFGTLTFVVGDVGFGVNNFYATGALTSNWQSVSFAAIADRAMNDGGFAVSPSASSGLALTLTVVPGSTGTASITGPVAGVFIVTPLTPGRIVLQATQAGQTVPTPYEYNMLRQGFSVGPGSTVGQYVPPGVIAVVPPVPGDPTDNRLPLLSDFNRDGSTDLIWQNRSTGAVSIWLMNGSKVVKKRAIRTAVAPSNKVVGAGDFNGDGRSDILWRDSKTGKLSIWIMRGTHVRSTRAVLTKTPKSKKIVGLGDFNRDGKTDIVWHVRGGGVGLWLVKSKSAARLTKRSVGRIAVGWQGAGAGDFNGDGNVDILWNAAGGNPGVWLMNKTTYASSTSIDTVVPTGWKITGTGDFNRDGMIDILLRQKSGPVGLWLMDGTEVASSSVITRRPRSWEIHN